MRVAPDSCRFPRNRLSALLALSLAILATIAGAAEESRGLPRTPAPASFVGLRMAPGALERGFDAAVPVEVRELAPKSKTEADALAKFLPPGVSWQSAGGILRPALDADPAIPCRAYAVGLTRAASADLKARIAAVAPAAFRSAGLEEALDTMTTVILETAPGTVKGVFPVPFGAGAPQAAGGFTVRAIRANTPIEGTGAAALKIDGMAVALLRELVKRQVLSLPVARAAALSQPPYAAQSSDGRGMAAAWVSGVTPAELLVQTFGPWFAAATLRDEVVSLPLAAGRIPGASAAARTVPLAGQLGLLPATGAPPALGVGFRGSANPGGEVDFDGAAWPAATGTSVEIYLTAQPLAGFAGTRAALIRQSLRGWRWLQILKLPAATTTQTLLRMNEPFWELLIGSTVRDRLAPPAADPLDAVELKLLDSRIADARAAASRAEESLQAFTRNGVRGAHGDGFFPAASRLDHRLGELLLGAFDGAGGAAALLAGARSQAAALARAKLRFARQISRLVSEGFTRPETSVAPAAAVRAILRAAGVAGAEQFPTAGALAEVKLEPDLVWLERAARAIPAQAAGLDDGLLAHLFAEFDGTRLAKALTDLIKTQKVQSMVWSQQPAIPSSTMVYLFYKAKGLTTARDPLLESARRIPSSSLPPAKLSTPIAFAYANEKVKRGSGKLPDEAWFDEFKRSRPPAQPTTGGDIKTFFQLYRKDRLTAAADAATLLYKAIPAGSASLLAVRYDPKGKAEGLVSPPGRAASELEKAMIVLFGEGAGMAAKFAELDGKPAAKGAEEFYASRIVPMLTPGDEVLAREWERYLIGPDLLKPARAAPYEELLARLQAVAGLARVTLTVR